MRVDTIYSFVTVLVLVNWIKAKNLAVEAHESEIKADADRLASFALLSLSIVDITTGKETVSNLIQGDRTCLSPNHPASKSLTVLAITTTGKNGTIAFDWDFGDVVRVESRPPYALAGVHNSQNQQIYHVANSLAVPGEHTLTVRVSQNALSFPTSTSTCIDQSLRDLVFDDQEETMKCSSIRAVSEITIKIKVGECISDIFQPKENKARVARSSSSKADSASRLISARNVVEIRGALQQWQKVTLLFNGPIGSERGGTMPIPHGTRAPNLFADYLFQMEFQHITTGTTLSIPGYFAADGHAATSGAVSGHVWACHFRPPLSGEWQYTAYFKYGIDITRSNLSIDDTTTAHFFDGHFGVLHIAESGSGNDIGAPQGNSSNYQLSYSSASSLTTSPKAHIFDSTDFDGYEECRTVHDSNTLGDWNAFINEQNTTKEEGSPSLSYSWGLRSKRPKGFESISMIQHHISAKNHARLILPLLFQADHSFISPFVCQASRNKTMSQELPVNSSSTADSPSPQSNTCGTPTYSEDSTKNLFSEVIETDKIRIDVSKTDQWSRILDWATDEWGVTWQLLLEDSNTAHLLDDGSLGPQRKLYYREMVARFGHYKDLIWDLGLHGNKKERRKYLAAIDPYQHVIL